jgi:hypothetical protein
MAQNVVSYHERVEQHAIADVETWTKPSERKHNFKSSSFRRRARRKRQTWMPFRKILVNLSRCLVLKERRNTSGQSFYTQHNT